MNRHVERHAAGLLNRFRHFRGIKCSYRFGKLTLHGNVPTGNTGRIAAYFAHKIPGIRRVRNQTRVVRSRAHTRLEV